MRDVLTGRLNLDMATSKGASKGRPWASQGAGPCEFFAMSGSREVGS
jgi:hypothetical protein